MRQYHLGLTLAGAGFLVMLGGSRLLELAGGGLAAIGVLIALRAERPRE